MVSLRFLFEKADFLENSVCESLRLFRTAENVAFPALKIQKIHLMLDNTRVHHTEKVYSVMKELRIDIVRHPSYSPDLMPLDYMANPKLKVR